MSLPISTSVKLGLTGMGLQFPYFLALQRLHRVKQPLHSGSLMCAACHGAGVSALTTVGPIRRTPHLGTFLLASRSSGEVVRIRRMQL